VRPKRARFVSRLRARGLPPDLVQRLTCRRIPEIGGKQPAVIAIAVAAQLVRSPNRCTRGRAAAGPRRVSRGSYGGTAKRWLIQACMTGGACFDKLSMR